MKFLVIAFAVIAAVAADVSHLVSNEYLPPVHEAAPIQLPTNDYLPPVQHAAPAPVQFAPAPAPVQFAPAPAPVQFEAAPAHELADDGYRYKTHRRVVYRRHRRDVSHLPTNEYLPPVQEAAAVEFSAPVQEAPVEVQFEAAPAHELAADGYRYKTHRRVVYRRNRRDVSHLPTNEYLPPVHEAAAIQLPSNDYLPPVQHSAPAPVQFAPAPAPVQFEAAPAHELADDGYRYKTHRRVVYRRHRRDVSHLPTNEYLPPVQEAAAVEYLAPVQEAPAPVQFDAEPAHELAADGYRYKTHRRVVYRRH